MASKGLKRKYTFLARWSILAMMPMSVMAIQNSKGVGGLTRFRYILLLTPSHCQNLNLELLAAQD
jgi:hypothetical protein